MISKVKISGFRGIPGTLELEFGEVTLLSGRNGLGKTTVFDALDWCLFGSSWRLGDREGSGDAIRNLYRKTRGNGPTVSVSLSLDNRLSTIERTSSELRRDGVVTSEKDLFRSLIRDDSVFPPFTSRVRKNSVSK